jgi:hypothetical protein
MKAQVVQHRALCVYQQTSRVCSLLGGRFFVFGATADGISSRRALHVPMLLPQDSRYSAALG